MVENGENAGNQHFLLFPVFSTLFRTFFIFSATSILSSTNKIALDLDQSKSLPFCKELRQDLCNGKQLCPL